MRKIMFIGRSESGKTTLTQAMKGNSITYHKTQYVNHFDVIIDFAAPDRVGTYQEIVREVQERYPEYHMSVALDADISD